MLTSTSVSDALDERAVDGLLGGVTAYNAVPLCGPAFTVHLCGPEDSDRPFSDYLTEVPANAVIVVDNGAETGYSVMGGLACAEARRHGASGAVVNGAVRDVDEVCELGFGLYAVGRTARSGRPFARLSSTGRPIDWGGVRIEPGDIVVADCNGVAVIPARHADDVLERSRAIESFDSFLREQMTLGIPLAVARRLDRRPGEALDAAGIECR